MSGNEMFRGVNTVDARQPRAGWPCPTRYRDDAGRARRAAGWSLTVDRADQCLLLYPLPEWEEIERKLMQPAELQPAGAPAAAAAGRSRHRTRARLARPRAGAADAARIRGPRQGSAMLIGQGSQLRDLGRAARGTSAATSGCRRDRGRRRAAGRARVSCRCRRARGERRARTGTAATKCWPALAHHGRTGVTCDATFGRGGHAAGDPRRSSGRRAGCWRSTAIRRRVAAGQRASAATRHVSRWCGGRSRSARGASPSERGWRGQVNGVLFDLGVSSPQLDEAGARLQLSCRTVRSTCAWTTRRGESRRRTGWRRAGEREIADVLRELGEERFARRIARAIVRGARRGADHAPRGSSPTIVARCRADPRAAASTRRRAPSRRSAST
ncbi:MAG: 16S rRNA (cytosine(1402)-N(4))-methyltransferase [Chromatiales bacterium]|nr:16S rRNA (cytosine(1402)-N(4))-methyltransferase [Chromatiales bacterium]